MKYVTLKELWKTHVRKMEMKGEKPVSLVTFYRRCNVVTGMRWSIKKAIETPAGGWKRAKKRSVFYRIKSRLRWLIEKK